MADRPYNAANRKDIRSAEKRAIVAETVRREVISGIMSVANGREWMNNLLAEAQVFADPFSPDPHIHAYNAGLRKVGIALFNDIMLYCPTYFETMIKEAYVRSTATERSRGTEPGREPEGSSVVASGPSESEWDPYATEGPSGTEAAH